MSLLGVAGRLTEVRVGDRQIEVSGRKVSCPGSVAIPLGGCPSNLSPNPCMAVAAPPAHSFTSAIFPQDREEIT
jgi:hypothetical protein